MQDPKCPDGDALQATAPVRRDYPSRIAIRAAVRPRGWEKPPGSCGNLRSRHREWTCLHCGRRFRGKVRDSTARNPALVRKYCGTACSAAAKSAAAAARRPPRGRGCRGGEAPPQGRPQAGLASREPGPAGADRRVAAADAAAERQAQGPHRHRHRPAASPGPRRGHGNPPVDADAGQGLRAAARQGAAEPERLLRAGRDRGNGRRTDDAGGAGSRRGRDRWLGRRGRPRGRALKSGGGTLVETEAG